MPAMVTCHSNLVNLLEGGITNSAKITVVNKALKVKEVIPVKVRQFKQFAAGYNGMNCIVIRDVCVK